MSFKTLALAYVAVVALSLSTFYNDMVLKNTHLIGNFLPVSVFGSLLLFLLILQPLLARIRRGEAVGRREIAAVVAILLFACYPLGRGLGHYFTTFLMMPHHWERTMPGWQAGPGRLAATDIRDADALRRALAEAPQRQPPGHPLRAVAERMPAEALAPAPAGATAALALAEAINSVLGNAELDAAIRPETLPQPLPLWVRKALERGADRLTPEQRLALRRSLFDLAAAGLIKPREPGVLERVHPRILADPTAAPSLALDGFVSGLEADPARPLLTRIPWAAWWRTLGFWIPLLFTMSVLLIGLALVWHRQWADHEHLPYPVVEFARTIMPEPGAIWGPALRDRIFWIGFLPVFAIHVINYAAVWFPDEVIRINLILDFRPLLEILPVLRRGSFWKLFDPTIYFTAIGFAYFLASDVALSLGIAPYVFLLISGILAGYGVAFGAGYMQPSIETGIYSGASLGMFLAIVYSGRHYLRATFARALGLPTGETIERSAVWGARVALLAFVAFVAQLIAVEVEWPLAVMYTLITVMIFTVMSRLLAESGLFFFKPYIFSCVIMWSWMGTQAIGPDQMLTLMLISSLLLIDPREALMPFAVTGLRLGEQSGARLGRIAVGGAIAVLLALVVMTPTTLYWQYRDGGIKTGDGWTVEAVPRLAMDINVAAVRQVDAQGALETIRAERSWERYRRFAPRGFFVVPFVGAAALVLGMTLLRHRMPRFPLHPVLLVFGMIYEARMMGFSFLLGWAIKSLITRYGGAKAYQRLKPLMIGLIGGELLASLVPLIVGVIYSAVTGRAPRPFRILPG